MYRIRGKRIFKPSFQPKKCHSAINQQQTMRSFHTQYLNRSFTQHHDTIQYINMFDNATALQITILSTYVPFEIQTFVLHFSIAPSQLAPFSRHLDNTSLSPPSALFAHCYPAFYKFQLSLLNPSSPHHLAHHSFDSVRTTQHAHHTTTTTTLPPPSCKSRIRKHILGVTFQLLTPHSPPCRSTGKTLRSKTASSPPSSPLWAEPYVLPTPPHPSAFLP